MSCSLEMLEGKCKCLAGFERTQQVVIKQTLFSYNIKQACNEESSFRVHLSDLYVQHFIVSVSEDSLWFGIGSSLVSVQAVMTRTMILEEINTENNLILNFK